MINVTDVCRALTPFHILFYFPPIFSLDPHNHLEKNSLTSGLPMRRWRPREMKRVTEARPRMKTHPLSNVHCLGHWHHGVRFKHLKARDRDSQNLVSPGEHALKCRFQVCTPKGSNSLGLRGTRSLTKSPGFFWVQWFKDHTLRNTGLREPLGWAAGASEMPFVWPQWIALNFQNIKF